MLASRIRINTISMNADPDLKHQLLHWLFVQGLLIAFAVCTVLLIAVHMLAVMISTCILPHVEAVSNLHLQTSNTVFESPHRKMSKIIELAWAFSTVLGILLFLGRAPSTQCWGPGWLGCFWASRIRIHLSEVQIRPQVLPVFEIMLAN